MRTSARKPVITDHHGTDVRLEKSTFDVHIELTDSIIDTLIVDKYRMDNDEFYISPFTTDEIGLLKLTTEKLTKLLQTIKI